MQNLENELLVIKAITTDFYSKDIEIHLTNKRMVFLRVKNYSTSAGAAGGLFGSLIVEAVQAVRQKKDHKDNEKKSFDDLIRQDKNNFDISFQDLRRIKLKQIPVCTIRIETTDFGKDYQLAKEPFNRFYSVAKDIDFLKGKIEFLEK